jgi:hypothetical protein
MTDPEPQRDVHHPKDLTYTDLQTRLTEIYRDMRGNSEFWKSEHLKLDNQDFAVVIEYTRRNCQRQLVATYDEALLTWMLDELIRRLLALPSQP